MGDAELIGIFVIFGVVGFVAGYILRKRWEAD